MLQHSILIDALSSACFAKQNKTNKQKEIAKGLFFQGGTCLAGCATGFLHLLGVIKGWFMDHSLNFIC
jgi:hypothetical protein